jgi:hypothetical protein
MADYKKNHYIPKFYLRNFTDNPTNLNGKFDFFNTKNPKYIGHIDHSVHMQESYFYPKDSDIEIRINKEFEGKHAKIIKDICNGQEKENSELLEIFLLMYFRTKNKRDEIYSFRKFCIDEYLIKYIEPFKKFLKKQQPELAGVLSDEQLKENMRNVAYEEYLNFKKSAEDNVGNFEKINKEISGLETAILKNITGINLISSDNPVILINPFLKRRIKNAGINGIFQIGVILFLPINSEYLLIAFDSKIYDQNIIFNKKIMNEIDITNLNKLQTICSKNGVYSKKIHKNTLAEIIMNSKNKVEPKIINIELPENYFISFIDDALPDLEFTFIKEKENAGNILLQIPFAREGSL